MTDNFEKTFTVKHFECDPWLTMSMGAVLRRVQTISTSHADLLGLTPEVYAKTNTVFLLSKTSALVNKLPSVYDKVTISTRVYAPVRASFSRITTLHSENGELLCEVDSRLVLVDLAARRIMRKPPQEFEMRFLATEPDVRHKMTFGKTDVLDKEVGCVAAYSLCDYNKHINNTSYVDIICDILPIALFEKARVSRMVLLYRSEIALGKKFSVRCGKIKKNAYYTLFECEGKKSLEGYFEFMDKIGAE